MSEYGYLRMAVMSRMPLSALDLEHHDCGSAVVWWVRGTRAQRPAIIVTQVGYRPMAPSADMLISEHGTTAQLFKAGVDDSDLAGAGSFTELWIEPQGRTLRV